MKLNLLVSPLSTKLVNIFRLFFFFSVVTQFAHATCHDAGSDVTKTHSPTKENGHKHLEHRSNTGDNWPDTAALAQQHFTCTGKYEGFEKIERSTECHSI